MNDAYWLRVVVCAALSLVSAGAQEAGMAPQQPGAQRSNLREFLGLGPAPDAEAAKRGEPLYKENCAACHGATARGAQGPNLVRSAVVLHDEKGNEIGAVIKQGRAQSGMPAFPDLKEAQTYDISQYIHLQVELAANRGTYRQTYSETRNQVTGNVESGNRFFQTNCSNCHSASGDMAKIGSRYPQASTMLSRIAWPVQTGPRQATVHTQAGESIIGTVVELNDFDVSLRDQGGTYHSWPRDEVKVESADALGGHRALLPKYTDADLHNLTAYLVTLK